MSRLVYYSLTLPDPEARPDLVWQLETSLSTLRSHNGEVPVVLFVYGEPPIVVREVAARHSVLLFQQEPYEVRLARLCPRGWPVLCQYPLLHKFLNFGEVGSLQSRPTQVLYVDCDTVFFDDVDRLFARYSNAHVVAREEVSCRRSHYGYDSEYLDEDALDVLGQRLGSRPTPPFNLGVVLFNASSWLTLVALEPTLLDYAFRFAVWMALHPAEGRAAAYGEGLGIERLRHQGWLTDADREAALPYPSANRWLLDEMVLWLTLGHLPGLSTADFSTADVLQNGELDTRHLTTPSAVLCHYFSQSTPCVHEWMQRRLATTQHSRRGGTPSWP